MVEKLLPGSKFTKKLTVCRECKMPDVEEVDHVPSAKDETKYYCSTCGVWNEGTPAEGRYKLEVIKSL